jgi:hypothetical protein
MTHVGDWINDKTLELIWKGCYEKEDLEEKITVNWVSKNQIEVKEVDYSKGKLKLSATYVFKRKETKIGNRSSPLSCFLAQRRGFSASIPNMMQC